MAIRSVRPQTFDAFRPARGPFVGVLFEEVEWFVDSDEIVLGVLTRDFEDNDWGYAVLGRDTNQFFRAIAADVGIQDRDAARTMLISTMEKFLSTKETV